ncbi:hypothetical protein SNL152K_9152 [Streptomyces sp. NL15-2K]|nr:hypothetical protein SNL152K_9152 [Streptomyces sp. NL15-2K]
MAAEAGDGTSAIRKADSVPITLGAPLIPHKTAAFQPGKSRHL